MDKEWMLTPQEQSQSIQQNAKGWFAVMNTSQGHDFLDSIADGLCKAQAKKLLDWLEAPCREHNHFANDYWLQGKQTPKHSCPECMSQLREGD